MTDDAIRYRTVHRHPIGFIIDTSSSRGFTARETLRSGGVTFRGVHHQRGLPRITITLDLTSGNPNYRLSYHMVVLRIGVVTDGHCPRAKSSLGVGGLEARRSIFQQTWCIRSDGWMGTARTRARVAEIEDPILRNRDSRFQTHVGPVCRRHHSRSQKTPTRGCRKS